MMKMNTNNAIFAMLIVAVCSVVVNGFQQQRVQFPMTTIRTTTGDESNTTPRRTSTAVYGIFDKMVKNMESGYAGGEESPYAKIKEKDKQKEVNQKKRSDDRRNKGYTELKDVKEKSFVKLKYGNKGDKEEEEPKEEKKKKLFGMF